MSKFSTDVSPPNISLDGFTQPNDVGMLGVVTALASEVYILKAEVRRLTAALEDNDLVNGDELEAVEQTEAMESWLASEQKAFTAETLRPWLEPDPIADARHFISNE